jgi:hypothetical protein
VGEENIGCEETRKHALVAQAACRRFCVGRANLAAMTVRSKSDTSRSRGCVCAAIERGTYNDVAYRERGVGGGIYGLPGTVKNAGWQPALRGVFRGSRRRASFLGWLFGGFRKRDALFFLDPRCRVLRDRSIRVARILPCDLGLCWLGLLCRISKCGLFFLGSTRLEVERLRGCGWALCTRLLGGSGLLRGASGILR